MKAVSIFCLAALLYLPCIAQAAQQCEKDASGEVNCEQVSDAEPGQPGAIRGADDEDTDTAQPDSKADTPDTPDDSSIGDKTNQARKPGMTY